MTYTLTKEALESIFSSSGLDKYGMLEVCVDPSERLLRTLFWRDDMEAYNQVKWSSNYPTDVLPTLVYVNNEIPAFEGDYVLRTQHATARYFEIVNHFSSFKEQKIAFEMRWYKRGGSQRIIIGQLRTDNTVSGFSGEIGWVSLRSDDVTGWILVDSTGGVVNLTDAEEVIRNDTWNYMKIIIDWQNHRFHRLITNALDLDLTSYGLYPTSNTAGMFRILLGFTMSATVTPPYPCYIDDTRLYLNEV